MTYRGTYHPFPDGRLSPIRNRRAFRRAERFIERYSHMGLDSMPLDNLSELATNKWGGGRPSDIHDLLEYHLCVRHIKALLGRDD